MRRRLYAWGWVAAAAGAALLAPRVGPAGQEAARAPGLRVGEDRAVSQDEPGLAHVEPHVAMDPADPDRLVAASIVLRSGQPTSDLLLSDDGGVSWTRRRMLACGADPWVTWGSGRTVYFTCLGVGEGPVAALVFRSVDGGRTWSGPAEVPRGGEGSFDHTSAVVLPGSDSTDVVILAGMQGMANEDAVPLAAAFVSRSTDGGRSFAAPHRLVWSNAMANALNPVIQSDGTVGLAFMDFSVDGRTPLEHPRIWWVRSSDGGRTYSVPHLVVGVTRVRTLPLVAAGRSSGGDILYLAYDDVRGDRQGVFVVSSTDGGVRWGKPIEVSVGDVGSWRAENPAVAADVAGNVGIAWYERPAAAADGCWKLRFTASADRGQSFFTPVTLSSASFCADPERVEGARRWPTGGDYFGLTGYAPGAFRVVWSDTRSGVWQLRTTTVRLE